MTTPQPADVTALVIAHQLLFRLAQQHRPSLDAVSAVMGDAGLDALLADPRSRWVQNAAGAVQRPYGKGLLRLVGEGGSRPVAAHHDVLFLNSAAQWIVRFQVRAGRVTVATRIPRLLSQDARGVLRRRYAAGDRVVVHDSADHMSVWARVLDVDGDTVTVSRGAGRFHAVTGECIAGTSARLSRDL
ncbi:hypothetical protein [Deinococcus kurensis]|uniref:hypothetical protein n=1 Tax=Deinococcus kurensis TaxID=2662757 RepID=UPI0012D352FF|nr:hypothetical protein [Deinococcus kurensis]